jgi:hypothetical protein
MNAESGPRDTSIVKHAPRKFGANVGERFAVDPKKNLREGQILIIKFTKRRKCLKPT